MKTLMTKAEFSRLCQISQPMLSPSKYGPYLVMQAGRVDALASLRALEGRLDAGKWTAAMSELASAKPAAAAPESPDERPEPGAADDLAEPQGWKGRRDKYAALTVEVDYHERVGALVDAGEIAAGVEAVIADFWTETERAVKLDAAEIASELKLDADRAAKLRSMLLKRNREMRANFARVCREAEKRFLNGAQAVA